MTSTVVARKQGFVWPRRLRRSGTASLEIVEGDAFSRSRTRRHRAIGARAGLAGARTEEDWKRDTAPEM